MSLNFDTDCETKERGETTSGTENFAIISTGSSMTVGKSSSDVYIQGLSIEALFFVPLLNLAKNAL